MIAIDTNILIYAHRAGCQENKPAQRAIEEAIHHSHGWGIPLPCISEFWAQVTHPHYPGDPSTPSQARSFLHELIHSGRGKILMPNLAIAEQMMDVACDYNLQGHRFFDLQIGLTALHQGAGRLWTHDQNFIHIPGLTIEDPLL